MLKLFKKRNSNSSSSISMGSNATRSNGISAKKVAIIGGGLSGLTYAVRLKQKGISFQLFEASERLGGRIGTDVVDGFKLDHGFQVFLTSYERFNEILKFSPTDLCAFAPGAKLFLGRSQIAEIGDPFRAGPSLFQEIQKTLTAPIGGLTDKLRILKLAYFPAAVIKSSHGIEETALEYLGRVGFSEKMIDSFFVPFFSGIFLTRKLDVPASYFIWLYRKFSVGDAVVPIGGMGEIVERLVRKLQKEPVFTSANVIKIRRKSNQKFELEFKSLSVGTGQVSGSTQAGIQTKEFDQVVLAVPENACREICDDLIDFPSRPVEWKGVLTTYFRFNELPFKGRKILLNSSGQGKIVNVVFLSEVNSAYAPEGEHLAAVNVLTESLRDGETFAAQDILDELRGWDVFSVEDWKELKQYLIPKSLPRFFGDMLRTYDDGKIVLTGDWTVSPSSEGAVTV